MKKKFVDSESISSISFLQNMIFIGHTCISRKVFILRTITIIPVSYFDVYMSASRFEQYQIEPIAIILSTHLDDAVLAMGGFLAKGQYETEVDTFFAGKPNKDLHTKWDPYVIG